MNVWDYFLPLLGAVSLEAVHWFELRERLHLKKYRKMFRSWSYWIPTMVMALVGSAAALVWALSSDGVESGWELLLAGAAAPTLLKKGATAIAAREDVVLGPEDEETFSFRDYFAPR